MSREPAYRTDKNDEKTREQLLAELRGLTAQVAILKESEARSNLVEEALRKSEASLAKAQQIAHMGSWEWDFEENFTYGSREFYDICGLDPTEKISLRSFIDTVHPDDRELVKKAIDTVLNERKPYVVDFRLIRKDGAVRLAHAEGGVVCNEHGKPVKMFGTVQDVTERRRAEKALHKIETFLNNVFNGIQDGISVQDKDLNILRVNKTMEQWYPDMLPLIGKKCYYAYHGRSEPCEDCPSVKSMKEKTSCTKIVPRDVGGKTVGWQEVHSFPLRDDEGDLIGVINHTRDITDRKLAEEALRDSEEKFKVLAETSSSVIGLYQGENFIYVNNAAEQLTGYTRDELLRMKFWDVVHPEYRDLVKKNGLARQRGEQVPQRYEVKLLTRDGRIRWVELNAGRIEYRGKYAGIVTFFDITERKQVENELKKSRFILAKSQEIAHMGNWAWNIQTDDVKWSDEGFRIFGDTPQEFQPTLKYILSHAHPDDRRSFSEFCDAVREGKLGTIDYRIVRRDGSIRYVNAIADKIVRDDKGNIKWVYGVNQDVTERKNIEDSLQRSHRELATIMDNMLGHAIFKDRNKKILMVNQRLCDDYGVSKNDVVGKIGYEFLPPETNDKISKEDDKVLATGSPSHTEMKVVIKGEPRYFAMSKAPLRDGNGTIIGLIGLSLDITERKHAEEALQEAKAQAELYLDLMGHDINNMNQVGLGFLELALDTLNLDEQGRAIISKSRGALESSSRLIDNVRKLQRAKSGDLQSCEMDLGNTLLNIKENYETIPGKNVVIRYEPVENCHAIANELLYDVFSNLVGNSIKHTQHDPVIDITLKKAYENGRLFYKVIIEDNGPGIPEDLKMIIFLRSLRGDTRAKGSGIGLYLVKTLVDSYHGRVWVEDRVSGDRSKGSRFVVMLPAVKK